MSTTTFTYTGGTQTFTVPAGCYAVEVDMAGGAGTQPSSWSSTSNALGDRLQFVLAVVPGQVLTVVVGEDAAQALSPVQSGIAGGNGFSGGGGAAGEVGGSGQYGYGGGGSSAILNAGGTLIAEAGGGSFGTYDPALNAWLALYQYGFGGGGGYTGGNGGGGNGGVIDGAGGGGGRGGAGGAGAGTGAGAGGTSLVSPAGAIAGNPASGTSGGAASGTGGLHITGRLTTTGNSYLYSVGTSDLVHSVATTTGYVAITVPAPAAPDLISPAPGSVVSAPTVFDWDYAATFPGNTMTGFVLRYMLAGASTWNYYNSASPSTPSATPIVNAATSPTLTFPTGIFTDGNSYVWNVANVDQGGQGPWATSDATFTCQAPATVTITAPVAAITESTTTVTWTATAGAGATLQSWRVQTYLAGVLVDDSGVQPGSGGSYSVSVGLTNGDSYEFVVTVTQTGPQSTTASTTQSVNFDGPGTGLLTATPVPAPSSSPPYVALSLQGNDNLMTAEQSSAVNSSGSTGWTAAHAWVPDTTHVLDGLRSFLWTLPSGATNDQAWTDPIPVAHGQHYTAMLSYYAVAAGGTIEMEIDYYSDAGGTVMIAPFPAGSVSSPITVIDTWNQIVATAVAPATAVSARVRINLTGMAAGGSSTWLDELGLIPGTNITTWTIGGLTGTATATIERVVLATGYSEWVRDASPTSPLTPAATTQLYPTVNDYECPPNVEVGYVVHVTADNSGQLVTTTTQDATATLSTDHFTIFDPLNPTNYADGYVTASNLSLTEALSAHKQVGNPDVAVVSDTVGGMSGTFTLRVIGQAMWQRLVGTGMPGETCVARAQRTVAISDPDGGLYYGRLGISPGGMTSGNESLVVAGTRVGANPQNIVKDAAFVFVSQPRPPD